MNKPLYQNYMSDLNSELTALEQRITELDTKAGIWLDEASSSPSIAAEELQELSTEFWGHLTEMEAYASTKFKQAVPELHSILKTIQEQISKECATKDNFAETLVSNSEALENYFNVVEQRVGALADKESLFSEEDQELKLIELLSAGYVDWRLIAPDLNQPLPDVESTELDLSLLDKAILLAPDTSQGQSLRKFLSKEQPSIPKLRKKFEAKKRRAENAFGKTRKRIEALGSSFEDMLREVHALVPTSTELVLKDGDSYALQALAELKGADNPELSWPELTRRFLRDEPTRTLFLLDSELCPPEVELSPEEASNLFEALIYSSPSMFTYDFSRIEKVLGDFIPTHAHWEALFSRFLEKRSCSSAFQFLEMYEQGKFGNVESASLHPWKSRLLHTAFIENDLFFILEIWEEIKESGFQVELSPEGWLALFYTLGKESHRGSKEFFEDFLQNVPAPRETMLPQREVARMLMDTSLSREEKIVLTTVLLPVSSENLTEASIITQREQRNAESNPPKAKHSAR